ncbi:aminotransferase class V-fold PLP-dependent enzyme [archaeon]|nr:aminotransferase class V-fold PLP-dependent enzyme [archaeon]
MVKKSVYLDNSASTRVLDEVVSAMIPYFTEIYGNPSSLHSFGIKAKKALDDSRKIVANSINANPEEIIFTSGGTESDNIAVFGVAAARKDGRIITTKIEHPAIKNTVQKLKTQGFEVLFIDVDYEGFINIKQLEESINADTILVSIIHANNEIGTIQDIETIGNIIKTKNPNTYFHVDAVQSYMKLPIDVVSAKIDLLSIASHKIHGPKGVGALYIRNGVKLKSLQLGGSHEKNLRAGTENVPGIVGFAKAVELNLVDLEEYTKNLVFLRDRLIDGIEKRIPHVILNGPRGVSRNSNNVNISFKHIEGESILLYLDMQGIAVSTGSACSSTSLKPSHVLEAIGLPVEICHGSIRFTLSRYTTKEEIDYVLEVFPKIIAKLRALSPLNAN